MRRDFIATTGETELSVTVEPLASGQWRVAVGDRVHVVDARLVRPGTWSLLIEGRSYVVDLDERKKGTAILAGTSEVVVELEDARRKQLARAVSGRDAGRPSGEVVRAPIAGKIVKVICQAGDEIAAGQSVAVLEAMKMENDIKAERGGKVATIHVRAGQSVDTGESLITLAPGH